MAKVDVIQTSFSGGEFGASLFGRTDIAQYANACEIVENFLVRSYGSAISTPGTKYIATVSDSTLKTRLIKFVFNRSDAYAIEMGPKYFRFYTNGGVVVTTGTTPYQLTHIYSESEIFDVQFTQLNDVIWLTHPDHLPQKLTRLAAASWTIADFAFLGGPFMDENTNAAITITPSATTGTINITVSPTNSNLFTISTGTLGHHNSYWAIGGLAQTNSTTGLQEEGYVQITYVTNSYTATATVIKNLKVSTATTKWSEGAWSAVRGYPARVTFHERRLFFARTAAEPQKVWGSKVFEFDNYALDTQADDDALNLALASNESNEIQWLASGKSLIAATYGGAFIINSGSTEPITPSNANASEEVGFGAEDIMPKRIGNFFYYIQRFGTKLRELFYLWDFDTYKAVDKTIFSPHILGDGVIDMDVAQHPEPILYCVLTNGTLATLAREVDQEVQAWSRQTTAGTYSSIAIIPSQTGLYDEVWVIVERWVNSVQKRYVEQFQPIDLPDRQDMCIYLHSALTYSAFDSSSTSTATISLQATGGTMTITASTAYFAAGDVGQRIRAINTQSGIILGEAEIVAYTSGTQVTAEVKYNFGALSYAAGNWGLSVQTISGLSHLEAKEVIVLADGGTDLPAKTVASGVIQLAYDYFIVHVGLQYDQIIKTLPKEAGSVRGTAQGKKQRINEIALKVNRSHKGFKVGGSEDSLDIVSYIESTTTEILYTGTISNADFVLERVSFRDPATPLGTPEVLFTGIIPNISFRDDYQYGSQVYIKNEEPLPMEILSIMMTLETYDK